MSIIALTARLASLEAQVKDLRTPSLTVFMDCLKAASPEEVKTWLALSREVAEAAGVLEELEEPKPKKVSKAKKEKEKKVTNETGPSEWNVFLNSVWRTMAASHGIVCEDANEFKKAVRAAGKDSGFTYQDAMKEASRQKAILEGNQLKAQVKVQVKVQAKAQVQTKTKVQAEEPEEEPESEEESSFAKEEESELIEVEHDGKTIYYDPKDNLAYSDAEGLENIGSYLPSTDDAEAEFIAND